ncbi:MaoC/PaaZ C-terminal domain-containing protein [Actibacterium sp. XHP0104]|uniref:MaoC/PaaZ C-terminal domain-containing protein n=1 Tax=Actibacterium sp. XHP0104 TaxID=2984335 RepID=UPI0021E759C8|nr:MaoC/PaaZ C-terminal domain-containing protein [Actibacterium sp. XHP0104]MCV2881776.1 MaoC/PaaZ C-terminal domain-containing protein [Actibacterium sp. XHP0104]
MDYNTIKTWSFPPIHRRYGRDETVLYNLSIGFGAGDLPYVYEGDLAAFPTMAFVLASPGMWFADPRAGMDATKLLHAEQQLEVFSPLAPEGEVLAQTRVTGVTDKGPRIGALISTMTELHDQSGKLIARTHESLLCRGDGGLDGSDPAPARLPSVPDRPSDDAAQIDLPENAAVLYRLTGDRNPLHVDPAVAGQAGFDRPILHGLCTLGQVARVLTQRAGRPLTGLRARFSAPVYPGETLDVQMWDEAAGTAFIARSAGGKALDRGFASFSP